jgi:hypothetical protein
MLDKTAIGQQRREQVARHLDTLTPLLPEPEQWAVEGKEATEESGEATALLVSANVVFSVKLKVELGAQTSTLLSWPLVAERARVELRREAAMHKTLGRGYGSHWTFELANSTSKVSGFTTAEGEADDGERFGRAVASKLGWAAPTRA